MHELVRSPSFDRSASPAWEGTATLELFDAPSEELSALAPAASARAFA